MEVVFSNEAVAIEHRRWADQVDADDRYDTADTVGPLDVLRAHFLIADFFYGKEAGMGGIGPRDLHLLHSAVYRQFVAYGGVDKCRDLITDSEFERKRAEVLRSV